MQFFIHSTQNNFLEDAKKELAKKEHLPLIVIGTNKTANMSVMSLITDKRMLLEALLRVADQLKDAIKNETQNN